MKRISVRNHDAAHVYYGLARRIQAMLFVLVMLVSSVGLPAIAEDDALQPNIYGMVQTRKLEEKQLTASLNGNSEITVTYGQAAQIPDGAQLVVTPVDDEAPYVQQAKKDLNVESVDFVQLFDMGIYYDGAKIEPANKVKISFRLTEDMKRDGDLRIIHFAKDPEPVPAAAPKKLMSVKGAKAAPMATQAQTDEDDLMSVQAAVIDTSITEELNLVFNEENMVSFETYGFSVFGICYTVDFVYENAVSTLSINLENFQESGNDLLLAVRENNHYVTILPVADIVADAPAENGSVYTINLHENASKEDYGSEFFVSAAVGIEGTGIEVSESTIRLTADVAQGKVIFTGAARTLEVEISNYTRPAVPVAYAFHGVGDTASISEILEAANIVSSYTNPVVSDETLVTVEDDTLTTAAFFAEATLTLTLDDGSEIRVQLTNPEFIAAGQPVVTEGVGSFAAATDLQPGAALSVSSEVSEEDQAAITEAAKTALGEGAQIIFRDVQIVDAEGQKIETGARVTLPVDILLPTEEEKITKVQSLQVFHLTENGVESVETEYTLAEGKISSVTFTSEGFSPFGIAYTIDFVSPTGKEWSWPGEGEYPITDILEQLGITGTVTSVTLERTDDQGGAENVLYLQESEDGWRLISETAFQDTFLLTVTVLETVTDENGEETQVEKVYAIQVKDEIKDTLTTTIKFFAKDAEIIKADPNVEGSYMHIVGNAEAPNDPALASTYYVLAILKDSLEHETGWAIQSIGTPTTDTTTVSFNEFNLFETQNEGEAAADYKARRGQVTTGEKVGYDKSSNTIETRLYRADTALATVNYCELVTKADTNKTYSTPEEGYEFGGNFTSADGAQNEIDLKKANNKKYKVRIYLDANAADDITSADHYYLYLKVNHQSNDISYQYVPLTFTASEKKGSYVEYEFPHWMDENGTVKAATASNNTFTGNESSIEVKLLKFDGDFKPNNYTNATVNEEGSAIKAYKVHYDTAETNPQVTTSHYYEEPETVDGKTVVNCIDRVELQIIDAEGQYNYASILGPNLNYGIVADHLFHDNHLQTNFAVNHYTGHGHDARPDLSGSSGGQIVIAEYNEMVSNFWQNGPTNGVGPVATGIPNGQLKIGNPLSGTLVVYADIDSGCTELVDSHNNGKVAGNLAHTVVIQTEGEELSANIVEPALHYMDNMSAELASHPATFVPPIPSSGKLTIDTKAFPDDATIFIDADPIISFISSAGDLIIEKKPDQTIIFNFKKTRTKAADAINLAQFVVKQEGFPAAGYETHSPVGTGDPENVHMDAVARHIVWNLYGVQGRTNITTSGGIFLQPNEDSEIIIMGTTAGWIVSEGVVSHPSGEWHNVYAEMPATSSVKLHAYKTVDGKQPRTSQKFNFFLDEYNTSVDGNWSRVFANTMNTMGSIDFPEIKNLTTGWHVYRITEDQVKPAGTNGLYVMDGDTYYAAVRVQSTTTPNGQAATIVSTPVYYRNFDPNTFDSSSNTLTGFNNEDKINRVTFDNVEVKEGLNILKKVQGTTATDVEFTFKLELWFEEGGTTSPLIENTAIGTDAAKFDTSAGPDTFTIYENENENNHSVGYITLKAGELVTITNQFNKAAHYKITETKVNGQPISTETYVQGYKGMTQPQTGSLQTGGFARVVFENEYKAEGDLTLTAHKKLTDKTGSNKQLAVNSFAFRLGGLHADTQWVWNDANGNATLPTIHFTSADMEGAVPDPNNNDKLTKTMYYAVHEKHELGTGATYLAAQNLTYDSDKHIAVTLVDNGDGTITATPDVNNFTVEFDNTYEYQVTKGFDGIKTLTGRDMESAEFWFNAVLTKYHNGTTETTYADDTAREAAATFVLPTKLEGINQADGTLVFPTVTFKQPGTYTFTVTEDETRLPEDVEPTTPGQSYEVTIVVSQSTASNGDTILVASEPTYPNNKTIYNTQKKMSFTVTKDWKDMDNQNVNSGSITFTVMKDGEAYSVTSEHIEQVTGTPGGFTVNNETGTVTLTADATGWPTVRIKELNYPTTAAGYTVVESTPEASSENADVKVKYALNTPADQDDCPAIKHDEDAVVIKNTEEDNSTSLKVTKHYVLPDGSSADSIAKHDPIYFAVKVHHNDDNWTSYYDNGHAITLGNSKAYQITWDSAKNEWTTVDIGEIPDKVGANNDPVVKYEVVELAADGNVKITDADLLDIKYYTNYGKATQAEVTPIEQGHGAAITIENKIPQPRHLTVTKKWVDENDDEYTDLTGKNSISFVLAKNAYNSVTYAKEENGNITFVSDRDQATAFTLTGSIVNGHQVWTTKVFDNLPYGQEQSTYYLVETVGNGPEVTYILDDGTPTGTPIDEDHRYNPNTSGTITIVNKQVDKTIKVKKVWIGDNPPASIDVVLQHTWENGVNSNWGWQTDDRKVLNAENGWEYSWDSIVETDSYGTRIYRVQEYEHDDNGSASNAVSGYNVEYSSNNGTLKAGDTVTITNTKQTTGIAVHKVWDVENDNDIKPVTVQLMKAGESLDDDARQVTVVALNQYENYAEYGRTTYYVKNGTDIVINVGYNFKEVKNIDYTLYYQVGNDITISNVTADGTITVIVGSYEPTVTYTKAVTYNKESGTVVDSVPLSASNNWYKAWTTSTTPAIDGDSYYFVVETAVDGTPLASTAYVPTYTNNDGIKTGLITITNRKTETPKGSVKVTKVFDGLTSEQFPADFQITNTVNNTVFGLNTDDGKVAPTGGSGTTADPYYWQIDDLDVGTVVTFTETGLDVTGYDVSVTANSVASESPFTATATAAQTTPGVASFVNTYTPQPGSLTITKVIKGVESTDQIFTFEVTFKNANDTAYVGPVKVQDATRTTPASVTTDSYGKLTVTITGAGSATITEIPAGTKYTVVEKPVPAGWETEAAVISGGDADQVIDPGETETATVTNEISPTTITVKKTWNNSTTWLDNHLSVEMTLKANGEDVATPLPQYNDQDQTAAVWLTSTDATDGKTWHNLPKYDNTGAEITYTVVETGMKYDETVITNWQDAFNTTTPSTPTDGVFTIDNTPNTTEIQVTKEWTLNGQPKTTESSISYELHQAGRADAITLASPLTLAYSPDASNEAGKIKYVSGENGSWQTVTISKLPKYELKVETTTEGETTTTTVSYVPINYYVVETDVNAPTVTTYRLNSGAEGEAAAQATNGGTITIINRDASVNIGIVKIDETTRNNTPSTKLLGASFQLYKGITVTNGEGQPSISWSEQGEAQTTSSASGSEGTLTFSGLTEGRYKIVETQAPAGYNNLTGEIYFTISVDGVVTWTDENGNTINSQSMIEYNSTDKTFVVGNTPGVELPSTGGPGTAVYLAAGIALMALALILAQIRRKRSLA